MTAAEMGAGASGRTRAPTQIQLRVASVLMMAALAAGAVGFVVGAVKLPDEFAAAEAVAIWSVGVVGVLSWFRHFIFYRGDAARMGWTGGLRGLPVGGRLRQPWLRPHCARGGVRRLGSKCCRGDGGRLWTLPTPGRRDACLAGVRRARTSRC